MLFSCTPDSSSSYSIYQSRSHRCCHWSIEMWHNSCKKSTDLFFIWSFTVSVAPSINRPDFSNDSMILIILSIPSFEINKVNPLPALTTTSPLILFPSLSITFEVAYLGKLFLVKGIARSVVFFPSLNQNYLNCWIYHKEIHPI